MSHVYQAITLIFVLLVGWNMWKEEKFAKQLVAILVLIPFILRLLMIK